VCIAYTGCTAATIRAGQPDSSADIAALRARLWSRFHPDAGVCWRMRQPETVCERGREREIEGGSV